MADNFKCKGIHFSKKEGDKWVCMYCYEKVEDPNTNYTRSQIINGLCKHCEFSFFSFGLFCLELKTDVNFPVKECDNFQTN